MDNQVIVDEMAFCLNTIHHIIDNASKSIKEIDRNLTYGEPIEPSHVTNVCESLKEVINVATNGVNNIFINML